MAHMRTRDKQVKSTLSKEGNWDVRNEMAS